MSIIYFTVDSELLRELGEHLVGKPYVALAELIKNSYDADATQVTIELDPEKDSITVSDNGHGMDFAEFRDFWMRIGSIHKKRSIVSRHLKRVMTGSKGIGRLAAQFLAKELQITTVPENSLKEKLAGHVEWEEAIKAKELTKAFVKYEKVESKESFKKGTSIVLTKLNQEWDTDSIERLAKEIWWLQPPSQMGESSKEFRITFISPVEKYAESFGEAIRAIMGIWHAKIVGKNVGGMVKFSLQFSGKDPIHDKFPLEHGALDGGEFEIRIYSLYGRQAEGIYVDDARNYLYEFGGVHVYDAGFHLPYYGKPENDWLRIEFDHSHRLSASKLLDPKYRIPGGMTHLPTNSRILGEVRVNTTKEKRLEISITRDRLVENEAYDDLWKMVRLPLDFYAMEQARREFKKKERERALLGRKIEGVENVFVKYKPEMPKKVYKNLYADVEKTLQKIETEAEISAKKVYFLGPLATAGISALAYRHELGILFKKIENLVEKIEKMKSQDEKLNETLRTLKKDLLLWVDRAKTVGAIFDYYSRAENLKIRQRFFAKEVVEQTIEQVEILARGTPIQTERLDSKLLLPKASIAEWGAIFQNVLINAFNAMLDSEKPIIDVSSRMSGREREILVQNTGYGVDLDKSDVLFAPFERRTKISPERQEMGYGGAGLGLTIVSLIAERVGCNVSFVEPEKGFNTAFSIKWREAE